MTMTSNGSMIMPHFEETLSANLFEPLSVHAQCHLSQWVHTVHVVYASLPLCLRCRNKCQADSEQHQALRVSGAILPNLKKWNSSSTHTLLFFNYGVSIRIYPVVTVF